jgi:hypothetical protein
MRNAKMLLICLLFFSAQSQTPSPTPTKAGQPKESHGPTKKGETDTDKNITEPLESVIDQRGAVITYEETKEPTKQSAAKPPADWWARIFSALLIVVGAIQIYVYFRQATYMRRALGMSMRHIAVSKMSAQAAQRAADVLINDVLINSERAGLW